MVVLPGRPKVKVAQARLVVIRGLRLGWEYLLFEGPNFLGRAEEKPVDIDLQPLEQEDRIWSSLQHACINCNSGTLEIEDLGSANGTYANRAKVQQGEKRSLEKGDVIQIGTVQFKVLFPAWGRGPWTWQQRLEVGYQGAGLHLRPGFGPRLVVIRGLRVNREFLIEKGRNIIGRGDQEPVEIDIQDQEPADRVWASRQHACITRTGSRFIIEDLNTANATYVNRRRVPPSTTRSLKDGDVIQIGEVQLKVLLLIPVATPAGFVRGG